jgi:hypothetical protein
MSYIPARKYLKVWQGADFHYRFQWKVKVGQTLTVQDLSEWTARWTVTPIEEETPWRTFIFPSEALNGVFLNGSTGFVDLILKRELVETIPWKQATFELVVFDPIAKEEPPLLAGRLTLMTL